MLQCTKIRASYEELRFGGNNNIPQIFCCWVEAANQQQLLIYCSVLLDVCIQLSIHVYIIYMCESMGCDRINIHEGWDISYSIRVSSMHGHCNPAYVCVCECGDDDLWSYVGMPDCCRVAVDWYNCVHVQLVVSMYYGIRTCVIEFYTMPTDKSTTISLIAFAPTCRIPAHH